MNLHTIQTKETIIINILFKEWKQIRSTEQCSNKKQIDLNQKTKEKNQYCIDIKAKNK